MSEDSMPVRFADTAQDALDAAKTAGQLLREAREAQGMHVAALAVAMKVPVKKLEALEADRLEDLPDAVFVRALASSMCRALKIDPAPILAKLPQLNTRVLDQVESGMNVPYSDPKYGSVPSPLTQLNRPAVMAVVALLLAAIVLILLPDFSAKEKVAQTVSTPAAPSLASGIPMAQGASVPSVPSAGQGDASTLASGAASTTTVVMSVASNVTSASNTVSTLAATPALSTPSVASPTLTVSPLASPTAAVPVPADSVVVFTVQGESWIEVREAGGQIILQRTLQRGEKAGAGPKLGRLPFSVIVGRANETQVMVRGKTFDLASVASKDGVARFDVK